MDAGVRGTSTKAKGVRTWRRICASRPKTATCTPSRWDGPSDGKLRIKSLARGSRYLPGEITKVELLGAGAPLAFERTADALVVTMPGQKPNDIAYALRIRPNSLGMA